MRGPAVDAVAIGKAGRRERVELREELGNADGQAKALEHDLFDAPDLAAVDPESR
jgi:hypothetical protein